MSSNRERLLLVYQCGTRSVVNLSDTRASTHCSSSSPLRASTLCSSPQPPERRADSTADGKAASEAGGPSSLHSPCSSLTVDSATEVEGAWGHAGALTRAALSPPPRPPPPSIPSPVTPPVAGRRAAIVGAAQGSLPLPALSVPSKESRIRVLSCSSASQSVQGASYSPTEHDRARTEEAHSTSQLKDKCRIALTAGESERGTRLCDAPPLVYTAAARHAKTREPGVTHQLSGEEPGFDRAASAYSVMHTTRREMEPVEGRTWCTTGSAASAEQTQQPTASSPKVAPCSRCATQAVPDAHAHRTAAAEAGRTSAAERTCFPDGDPGARCHAPSSSHDSRRVCALADATANTAAVAAAASAHTPRRLLDSTPRSTHGKVLPLAGNCVGAAVAADGSPNGSSHEKFSVLYATTSASVCTTPETSSIPDPANAATAAPAPPPPQRADAEDAAEGKNPVGDVAAPMAVASQPDDEASVQETCHRTRSASLASKASTATSAAKTPTPSPLRRQLLLRRLLAAHSTPSADTPSGHTDPSAASSPADGGVLLSTPTPLHTSRRKDAAAAMAAATPSWESLALITGFPTPVKLSPIPRKGYSSYANVMAAAAAAANAAGTAGSATPVAVGPHASPFSSPALSAIAEAEELHDASTPTPDAAVSVVSVTEADPFEASHSARLVESLPAARPLLGEGGDAGADSLSANSECSVSPIRVRAAQTTRVWTPQSSDASQHPPQQLTHLASLVDATAFASRLLQQGTGLPATGEQRRCAAPRQRQSSRSQRSSTVGATVLVCSADPAATAILSSHSSPSRAAPSFDRVKEEHVRADWMTSSPAIAEGPRCVAPAHASQPHRRPGLEPQTAERALQTRSLEPSTAGRTAPRPLADTVNLGTPTVSMILTPAQALGESCCSLFMPPATQCIQALPVPGIGGWLRGEAATVTQPSQQTAGCHVHVWREVDEEATEAVPATRRGPRRAPLLSPTLDDERPCDASHLHSAAQARHGAPAFSPSASARACSSMGDSLPEPNRLRKRVGEEPRSRCRDTSVSSRASVSEASVSAAHHHHHHHHHHRSAGAASSAKATQRVPSFCVAPEQGLSPSEGPTPPQVRRAHDRRGHSSAKEDSVRVRYRPTFTASSLAATYNIDSWL